MPIIALVVSLLAAAIVALQEARRRRCARDGERFFALSWDLLGVIGPDGRLTRLNPAWEKSLGWTPAQLKARPLPEFVHPDDRGAMASELRRLREGAGAAAFQNRFECLDGTHKRLSWTAAAAEGGAVYVVARDTGARVRLQPSVEETRNFLDSIVENIPDMVFVKDAKDLRFVLFNRAGETLLGSAREEFIGKTDYDFFPKDEADFFTSKDREVLESGGVLDIPEEPIKTPLGLRTLHTKKIAIRDDQGRPTYLLGISEDVTEQKRTAQLRSEILAMVTHELRTPLTSIVWGLDMLANGEMGALTGKALEVAKLSHGSAQLMARMINDYLDVEKIESGAAPFKAEPVDLARAVDAALRAAKPVADRFGVAFELRAGAPGAKVDADPERLVQAAAGLLANAAKFSPRGGTVEVAFARREGEGTLRLSVTDRGPEIPEELRAQVFRKFLQARKPDAERKDTGLGLSIAQAIAVRMGGGVGCESGARRGTTFFLDLPESSAAQPPDQIKK